MKTLFVVAVVVSFVVACGRAPGPEDSRKVVSEAAVDLIAADLAAIEPRVLEVIGARGGFVAASDRTGRVATWRLRVPSARLDETIAALTALGTSTRVHTESRDVTAEYSDTSARLFAKQTEEARLLHLLESGSGGIQDVLAVEKELSRVRGEIEELTGRTKVLTSLVALATLSLTITEDADLLAGQTPIVRELAQTLSGSVSALGRTVRALAIAMIALVPWTAALALCALPVVLLKRRGRRGAA